MNSFGLGFLTVGMIFITLGGLGAVGYIPFPSLGPSQSSLCVQSIVKMATVCGSAVSTGMDSISYAGTTIAPVAGGNPVGIPQGQSQGTLVGYYFLTSGTTLRSSSASWCSGLNCSPSNPLSVSNGASSSVIGLFLLSTQSPQMSVGTYYTYQFSITDSNGASSTLSGTVVPIAAAPTWTASVATYNGTYSLGGSSGGGVAGFNVYNVETPSFLITITNNAPVSSITLNVSPGGQSLGFSNVNTGGGVWQEAYSSFAVGQYTVTAVINSGGQSITAFSIRMTSINQLKLTGVTLTAYSTSCPYATSTASSPPYAVSVCQSTQGQTLTVTNSGCFTSTATTSSSTTVQGTTCSSVSATCSAGGCQATTTYTSGSGTGTSTTSTTSTSTSTSKTTVCPNSINCPSSTLPLLPTALLISGIIFTAIGAFLGRKQEGSSG